MKEQSQKMIWSQMSWMSSSNLHYYHCLLKKLTCDVSLFRGRLLILGVSQLGFRLASVIQPCSLRVQKKRLTFLKLQLSNLLLQLTFSTFRLWPNPFLVVFYQRPLSFLLEGLASFREFPTNSLSAILNLALSPSNSAQNSWSNLTTRMNKLEDVMATPQ